MGELSALAPHLQAAKLLADSQTKCMLRYPRYQHLQHPTDPMLCWLARVFSTFGVAKQHALSTSALPFAQSRSSFSQVVFLEVASS